MKTKSEAGRRSGPHVSETTAAPEQMAARRQLLDYFEKSPLNKEDLLFNLGLYVRSSLLVKFLVLNKLYERIKTIPGNIIEFGTWWGQNLVLFENLRAIHEPFNKQRRIIGFDTFGGYTGLSDKDKASEVWSTGSYSTGKGHKDYLAELLAVHEAGNILGHVQGVHELIEGDIRKTAPQFFKDSPETLVALAYFDVGLYEPTRAALEAVIPHLVPGSILLFDELTWADAPGEALAFKELIKGKFDYRIESEPLYPSKCIVTVV